MKVFKAFNMDLTARLGRGRYQYNIGKWHEESQANCIRNGFHACEYIFDCYKYYSIANSRLFECEAAGDIDEDGNDSKISCTKIQLIKELNIYEMAVEACVYIINHPNRDVFIKYKQIHVAKETAIADDITIAIGTDPHVMTYHDGVSACIKTGGLGGIMDITISKTKAGKTYNFAALEAERQLYINAPLKVERYCHA